MTLFSFDVPFVPCIRTPCNFHFGTLVEFADVQVLQVRRVPQSCVDQPYILDSTDAVSRSAGAPPRCDTEWARYRPKPMDSIKKGRLGSREAFFR